MKKDIKKYIASFCRDVFDNEQIATMVAKKFDVSTIEARVFVLSN